MHHSWPEVSIAFVTLASINLSLMHRHSFGQIPRRDQSSLSSYVIRLSSAEVIHEQWINMDTSATSYLGTLARYRDMQAAATSRVFSGFHKVHWGQTRMSGRSKQLTCIAFCMLTLCLAAPCCILTSRAVALPKLSPTMKPMSLVGQIAYEVLYSSLSFTSPSSMGIHPSRKLDTF